MRIDISHVQCALRRRLPFSLMTAAILAIAGLWAISRLDPMHRSVTELLVLPDAIGGDRAPTELWRHDILSDDNLVAVSDRLSIFTGPALTDVEIAGRMRSSTSFSVAPTGDGSQRIAVEFRHHTGETAALASAALAALSMDVIETARAARHQTLVAAYGAELSDLARTLDQKTKDLAQLGPENAAAEGQRASLQAELIKITAPGGLMSLREIELRAEIAWIDAALERVARNAPEASVIERDLILLEDQYSETARRLTEARAQKRAASQSEAVRVTAEAVVSDQPAGPSDLVLFAWLAAMVLAGGCLSTLILERLDRTVRRAEDLERRLGINAYAVLPDFTPKAA